MVKASITGSIIGNVLLVLGASFVAGGIKYSVQTFNKTAAGNFSFSFNITLTDQPDIKFDYDQNTYVR